jgi:hypothetical protein
MLWSHLSLGRRKGNQSGKEEKSLASRLFGRGRGKSGKKYGLFTRADVPSGLFCEGTLYHVLVEVTAGYWALLKMWVDKGFLKSMV